MGDPHPYEVAEAGVHTFTGLSGPAPVTQTQVSAGDTADTQVTGVSTPFDIIDAIVQVFSSQGPVGTLELIIRVLNASGDVVTADDASTVTVTLEEPLDDGSSSSATTTAPAVFTEGVAVIEVTNNQAEVVTVSPASSPTLTPISGTATFGTVAGSGIGVDLWRELKDAQGSTP